MKNYLLNKGGRDEMAERGIGDNELQAERLARRRRG